MGLVRNLAAHEIVGQLLAVLRRYGPLSAQTLNLVFMGMGEPLHNVEALIRALEVLCDPAGLAVPPTRITVSTAGHLPGLERLAGSRYVPELAVSVNGATDRVRRTLMPIGKKWPLAALRAALQRWPRRPHQKITLEYVLLADVNDDDESAEKLAELAGDVRHILNVIPFNAWGDAPSPYREPAAERVDAFVARLRARGCLVKVRRSRGRDVRAACGTLVSRPASLVG
jgi:23S rRNA (adenine2503-C2)-methyltransferase